jgi:hypothetical protein
MLISFEIEKNEFWRFICAIVPGNGLKHKQKKCHFDKRSEEKSSSHARHAAEDFSLAFEMTSVLVTGK